MDTYAREWLEETPYFANLPNGCNDWRWLFRKGKGNCQRTKNHGAPRADYPLLQVLALRLRGWPVRKIAARLGVAFQSVGKACVPFGVKPRFTLDSHPNDLWAGYVKAEILAFRKLEYAHRVWWGFHRHTERPDLARAISRRHRKKFLEKTKSDPYYVKKRRLQRITGTIGRMAKDGTKGTKFNKHLGCTYAFARLRIEQQFMPGMSWETWGQDWHIDHFIPLSSFDIMTRKGEFACCHYTNLRPLWAKENMTKNAKVTKQLDFFSTAQLLP